MLYRSLLSATAVFLLITGAQAAPKPKECPYADATKFDLEKIEQGVRAAPSCDGAFELFSICMVGATSDIAMSGVVTEKCEADFEAKLTKTQRRAYQRDQNRCERKYQRESGSEYRAREALCIAEVARSYARRARSGGRKRAN